MDAITEEQIVQAITENPAMVTTLMPKLVVLPTVKPIIDNMVDMQYKSKIDDEVSKIHSQYDDDAFGILGKRPGQKDGAKQKTYDFLKEQLTDYKRLLDMEGKLNEAETVKALKTELERIKTEGGGKHVQEIFDQAKLNWEKEKQILTDRATTAEGLVTSGLIVNDIDNALSLIKFNPDTKDSVKAVVLANAKAELLANSKIEEGKVIYLTKDGKPLLTATSELQKASDVLSQMEAIKDISLTETGGGGGGADTVIKGSIQSKKVDGKDDVQTLVLPTGSFKSRTEFQKVAEKAFVDLGISKSDPKWEQIMNATHTDYKVADLPAE